MTNYFCRSNSELNDPNSPYFLGGPSTLEQINNYLYNTSYGGYSGYSTNFLGNSKYNNRFITPLRADAVEIQGRMADRRRKEGIFFGIIGAVGVVGSLILFKKTTNFIKNLPLIGRLFKK